MTLCEREGESCSRTAAASGLAVGSDVPADTLQIQTDKSCCRSWVHLPSCRMVWQQAKGHSLLVALFYIKMTLGTGMAARAAGSMLHEVRRITV